MRDPESLTEQALMEQSDLPEYQPDEDLLALFHEYEEGIPDD
jgi:hypothetical protein